MASAVATHKAVEVQKEEPHVDASRGVAAQDLTQPYKVRFKIKGNSDLLFNRLRPEDLEPTLASATKGGKAKGGVTNTVIDLESKLYRCDNGNIGVPALMVKAAMKAAGTRFRDPQKGGNARCKQLFKEGVKCSAGYEMADLGVKDYIEDVVTGRNPSTGKGIVIRRPLIRAGWEAEFEFDVIMPDVINETQGAKSINFYDVLEAAGRCQGIGDYRPDYGTFNIVEYKVFSMDEGE